MVLTQDPSPSSGEWQIAPCPLRAYAPDVIAAMFLAIVIGERRWQRTRRVARVGCRTW